MPNTFAYLMLLAWPVVGLALFLRLPRPTAVILTFVGGLLLLPASTTLIDLPLLPPLNKETIPTLAVLALWALGVGAPRRGPRGRSQAAPPEKGDEPRLKGWVPNSILGRIFLLGFLIGPFMTILLNTDALRYATRFIPGLRPYDALSSIMFAGLTVAPLLIGRRFITSAADHRRFVLILAAAGVLYSLPTLFEARMYPQLHIWVYGFFQQSFLQVSRLGGWRPLVFMEHGLELALMIAFFLLSMATLYRSSNGAMRIILLMGVILLSLTLWFTNSLAAIFYGLTMTPLVLIAGRRSVITVSIIMSVFFLAYPQVRATGLLPTDVLVGPAEKLAPAKAGSLRYRLENEEILIAKAMERPIFGWGPWGRARVYDPETGRDLSTTDGTWIIQIGLFGWLGYLSRFGLLTLGVFMLWRRRRDARVTMETAGLCLVLAVNLIDMIPNSSMFAFTWLVGGALLGRAESLAVTSRQSSRSRMVVATTGSSA